MISGRNVWIVLFVALLAFAFARQGDAGGKGNPDRPVQPVPTRNPHYVEPSPNGEPEPVSEDTPSPIEGPLCGYLHTVPCPTVPSPTRANPFPPSPSTREAPPSPPPSTHVQACYPATDLGPDDVALLIEAVSEGYSIVIVKDVLATSPEVIVID
ncbi:MAG: hypothetical protein ACW99G_11395 [Candidatus Thorarchaeota archaeon]|jgi:hypothetical protein